MRLVATNILPTALRVCRINLLRAAEEVARYRRAQLSAIKLAGDINAKVTDSASLDELLDKIKDELRKLGPFIDLEAIREPLLGCPWPATKQRSFFALCA
jgi:hypothetical protein